MEAGLRISPDQWSSLLYGDSRHRTYMQSICDRLSTNSLQNAVEELHHIASQQSPERNLFGIETTFGHFEAIVGETSASTPNGNGNFNLGTDYYDKRYTIQKKLIGLKCSLC